MEHRNDQSHNLRRRVRSWLFLILSFFPFLFSRRSSFSPLRSIGAGIFDQGTPGIYVKICMPPQTSITSLVLAGVLESDKPKAWNPSCSPPWRSNYLVSSTSALLQCEQVYLHVIFLFKHNICGYYYQYFPESIGSPFGIDRIQVQVESLRIIGYWYDSILLCPFKFWPWYD